MPILSRLLPLGLSLVVSFSALAENSLPVPAYTGLNEGLTKHVTSLREARFDSVIEAEASVGTPYSVINLGTGKGVTVKEFIAAFEKVYGQKIPVSIRPARPGDVAGAFANADKAARLLGWKAELSIEQGIADALRWGQVRDRVIHY